MDYIRQYSSQGYTLDQIRAFLLKNNMPAKDVDEAIAFVRSQSQVSQPQNNYQPNIDSQLRNYFQVQSRNGYPIELIKSSLINQGYPVNTVNKIASEFNTVNVKHEVHISKGTIIGIFLAILIVSIAYFAFTNINFKKSSSLLDVSLSMDTYEFYPGDVINYQIYLTNMGSQERFDVILKYTIVDDSNKVFASKDETLALQTTASRNRNIIVPASTPAGRYRLQVLAKYPTSEAKSSSEFEVITKSTTKTNTTKPKTNTTKKPVTNQIYTPPVIVSGGKTFGELLTDVKSLSATDPNSASDDCLSLASLEQKDICFSIIADTSQEYNYCSRVDDVEHRDNCYLSFVMKGNVEVCDLIAGEDNKAFCKQLKLVQLMNKYYQENNTQKVLELSREFNPGVYNSNPVLQTYEYTYSEPVTIMDIVNTNPAQEEATVEETPVVEIVNNTSQDNQTNNLTQEIIAE